MQKSLFPSVLEPSSAFTIGAPTIRATLVRAPAMVVPSIKNYYPATACASNTVVLFSMASEPPDFMVIDVCGLLHKEKKGALNPSSLMDIGYLLAEFKGF